MTNIQKYSFSISPDIQDIIIGISLGDLNINRQGKNARLRFKQSLVHKGYIYHLFDLFSSYSNMKELKHNEYLDKRTNKVYTFIVFYTYSLPCFNYYYDLFNVNGVKRIPLNIGGLLTAKGLAYWAMDDGTKEGSGFIFCTDPFTLDEVELLVKVLKENFNLNCTIHNYRKAGPALGRGPGPALSNLYKFKLNE